MPSQFGEEGFTSGTVRAVLWRNPTSICPLPALRRAAMRSFLRCRFLLGYSIPTPRRQCCGARRQRSLACSALALSALGSRAPQPLMSPRALISRQHIRSPPRPKQRHQLATNQTTPGLPCPHRQSRAESQPVHWTSDDHTPTRRPRRMRS